MTVSAQPDLCPCFFGTPPVILRLSVAVAWSVGEHLTVSLFGLGGVLRILGTMLPIFAVNCPFQRDASLGRDALGGRLGTRNLAGLLGTLAFLEWNSDFVIGTQFAVHRLEHLLHGSITDD